MRRLLPVLAFVTLFAACTACATTGSQLGQTLSSLATLYQTNPELQVAVLAVPGDSHAKYLPPVEAWARARGIHVEYLLDMQKDTGLIGATGWNETGPGILVDAETSPNNKLLTLFHEIAHVLHGRVLARSRVVAETIAETTAFEACRRLGLNTGRESFTYLAQFDARERDEVLRLFGDQIDQWAQLMADAAKSGVIKQ